MAGDWIKMRVGLGTDPAVIAIADETGLDEFAVVGRLHRIWSWADQHLKDGNAPSVTKKWIDRYLCVTGFADAMQKEGWLNECDGGVSIPRFDRHNGQSAKRRALTAERVAKMKAKRKRNGNARGNAPNVTNALPREEKRREETNTPYSPPKKKAGDAETIYSFYPRKAGKAAAIKAIEKALKKVQVSELLDKTKAFAEAVDGADMQFVPHPATWYNQDRWTDDQREWKLIGRPKGTKPAQQGPAMMDYVEATL